MEGWRIAAAVVTAAAGLLLVLVTMAKTRDRVNRGSAVAMAGAVSFTLLALVCLFTLTVFPPLVAWVAAGVVATAAAVLLLVG